VPNGTVVVADRVQMGDDATTWLRIQLPSKRLAWCLADDGRHRFFAAVPPPEASGDGGTVRSDPTTVGAAGTAHGTRAAPAVASSGPQMSAHISPHFGGRPSLTAQRLASGWNVEVPIPVLPTTPEGDVSPTPHSSGGGSALADATAATAAYRDEAVVANGVREGDALESTQSTMVGGCECEGDGGAAATAARRSVVKPRVRPEPRVRAELRRCQTAVDLLQKYSLYSDLRPHEVAWLFAEGANLYRDSDSR